MFNSLRNKASWVIDELCSTDRNTITICVHNVLPPARQLLTYTPYCCKGCISKGTEILHVTYRFIFMSAGLETIYYAY